MAVQTSPITVEEFEQLAALPENADRLLEYIGGEVVEVVSNQRSSTVGISISFYIKLYLRENHVKGVVSGADGGYKIAGERYIPDVAYVSPARQAEPSDEGYSSITPDLAVEVLSPSNTAHEMRLKVVNYLSVGTSVWVVDPERKMVEVYTPGQPGQTVRHDGVLDGGAVLPGFKLAVKDIFEG